MAKAATPDLQDKSETEPEGPATKKDDDFVELRAIRDDHKDVLEVTVLRASIKNDTVEKAGRKQDSRGVYVTAKLERMVRSSHDVARLTRTPMFNDTFQFNLRNFKYDSVLHVMVKNYRAVRKDTLLGEVELHVGELDLGKVKRFPLKAGKDDERDDTVPNVKRSESDDSLLKSAPKIKVKDLHDAALVEDMEKVNKFIDAGHDVNEKKAKKLFSQNSPESPEFKEVTPLHCAVVAGNAKIAKRLLSSGADALVRSKDLQSPMHMAMWFGHGQILELLLRTYESVNQQKMKQQGVIGISLTTDVRLLNEIDPTMRKDLESMVWEAAKVDNVFFLNVLVGQLQWTVEDLMIKDNKGNTPLHIAVQENHQSKQFAQALVEMKSDLLNETNNAGHTVLNVAARSDMKFTLMGNVQRVGSLKSDSHFEEDSLGYWVYAKTVADILTDESTTMPITVGIYARWGAGKSFILNQIKGEIDKNIARAKKIQGTTRDDSRKSINKQQSTPSIPFPFSSVSCILALIFFVATLVGGVLSYMYYRAIFKIVLIVGTILTIFTCVIVGYLERECLKRIILKQFPGLHWTKSELRLIGIWLDLLKAPNLKTSPPSAGRVKVIHVQFNAWEYSGCSALWAGIVTKLCDEVETEIGPRTTRLYRVIHDKFMGSKRPPLTDRLWFNLLIMATLGAVMIVLAVVFGIRGDTPAAISASVVEFLCGGMLGAEVLSKSKKIWSFLQNMAISQRARLMARTMKKNFDQELGFMADVKDEVMVVTYLLRYFEAAHNKQYRVVVVVDDLDRCPKDKVTKVIEAVGILLSDPNSHFISLLAVDPRIVVKSIEESFGDVMKNANINGYEYLKKMVQLPICLPGPGAEERKRFLWDTAKMSATERKVMEQMQDASRRKAKREAQLAVLNTKENKDLNKGLLNLSKKWREDKGQESNYKPRSSDIEQGSDTRRDGQSDKDSNEKNRFLTEAIKSLQEDDVIRYVAGNPRHIRRLFNILCVSVGVLFLKDRLKRFTSKQVAQWVLLVEQWPYRMSWIIQYVEDFKQRRELGRQETEGQEILDETKLVNIFVDRVKGEISTHEEWCHLNPLDEDPEMFELFLRFARFTVKDMDDFLPYTVNLDLSIRQTIGHTRAQIDIQHAQVKQSQTSLQRKGESSVTFHSDVLRKEENGPEISKMPESAQKEADSLGKGFPRHDRTQAFVHSIPSSLGVIKEDHEEDCSQTQLRDDSTAKGSTNEHEPTLLGTRNGPDSYINAVVEEAPEEVCRNDTGPSTIGHTRAQTDIQHAQLKQNQTSLKRNVESSVTFHSDVSRKEGNGPEISKMPDSAQKEADSLGKGFGNGSDSDVEEAPEEKDRLINEDIGEVNAGGPSWRCTIM